MAKLNNVDNQQLQEEYPLVASFFASVGVLMCLIVTVMGIKLWWFKHRLSFEQTSLQNGAAGGQNPNVVVTRREKKPKFAKDKRWSQQIYQSVEVHGVFKQKTEDDMEFHRPQQLPQVRIRHAESAPSLILPPPRYKRRQEEERQSQAFEESGEIYETLTPTTNKSQKIESRPNSLVFDAADTRISLTFEEFENQVKFHKEQEITAQNIPMEIPQPPKRTNRSNSTVPKADGTVEEKSHRFLKSSQSIAVPEYRKVVERRSTGFHRPTEDDLTKINDFEEPHFEKFGDRRPTGYIKYEEVDFHLNEIRGDYSQATEQHDEEGHHDVMYDSGYLDNQSNDTAIEALRNEEIFYQNIAKETSEYSTSYGASSVYANHKELSAEYNDISANSLFEYASVQKDVESKFEKSKTELDFHFETPEKCDDSNYLEHMNFKSKEVHSLSPGNMEPQVFAMCDELEQDVVDSKSQNESYTPGFQQFSKTSAFEKVYLEDSDNIPHTEAVDYETIDITRHTKAESHERLEQHESKTVSIYDQAENFENFFSNPTISKSFEKDNQSGEYCEIAKDSETHKNMNPKLLVGTQEEDKRTPAHVNFHLSENINGCNENEEKFTLNQRRPTEFSRFKEVDRDQNAKPLQQHCVTFAEDLTANQEEDEKFTLNQRRPTEFSRFKFEKEENEQELAEKQTVRFEFNQMKVDEEKCTLNQRRPTGYITSKDVKEDLYEEIGKQQEIQFEDLYEEIQTPPITNKAPEEEINENPTTEIKTDTPLENDKIYKTFETEIDRPIAFVRTTKSSNFNKDSTTCSVWQELEQDIQLDNTQNIDEEFDKIRHSFEMNEADFLEMQEELKLNSPPILETIPGFTPNSEQPSSSGFGKSIEDDWENFEKLQSVTKENHYEIVKGNHQEIHITYNNTKETGNDQGNGISTISILKESKVQQISDETQKLETKQPRKSKVTFDFKTEEHVIPARRSVSDEDTEDEYQDNDYNVDDDFVWYEQDYDEDVYNKPPPPVPKQRLSKTKTPEEHILSPVLTTPTTISLFGSQISHDETEDDSWSAIRKHRHLTSQFHNLSLDSPTSPPPPAFPPPPLPTTRNLDSAKDRDPPKPAFRNPMAQLAIQRAKEVRSEMGGFKSRSIKDSKQAQAKRTSQEFLQLGNDLEDTDA